MYYIFNREDKVIGRASRKPNVQDLASRGQRAVEESALPPGLKDAYLRPSVRKIERTRALSLETQARDADGDGIAEIPADGKTKSEMTVTLAIEEDSTPSQPIRIRIRTTAGTLSHREVVTKEGKASFTLTSSLETVTAHVSASTEGFQPAMLELEFTPLPTPA